MTATGVVCGSCGIRNVLLIFFQIMAQLGMFVPASHARYLFIFCLPHTTAN